MQKMDEGRIPQRVMTGVMFGRRPVGKPRKRWMDSVKEDSCQLLQRKNWQKELWIDKIGGLGSRRLRPAMGCITIGRSTVFSVTTVVT